MPAETESGYAYRTVQALTKTALTSLLKNRFENAWAIVSKVDAAEVIAFSSAKAELLPSNWTEGTIFNESAELRWRLAADGYAAMFLVEKSGSPQHKETETECEPPAGFILINTNPYKVVYPSPDESHGFLLWGKAHKKSEIGNTWREARIPRLLCYPLETTGGPPRLVYWHYCEGAAIRWTRFVKLVEAKLNE